MPSDFDLLRPLDTEPGAPSTVDVQRAILDARRRKVRRSAAYSGAAALTVVAVAGVSVAGGMFHRSPPSSTAGPKASTSATAKPKPKPAYTIPGTPGWTAPAATAPTSCTVEQLPLPGGAPQALVGGADPNGTYFVGRSYPKGGGYQAVLWHDGKATTVPLPGDSEEQLTDVNTTGTAVGWSYHGNAALPYAFKNGKVYPLAGVKAGSAYAINDAGAIVGDDDTHALLWTSVTAKAIRLPLPAGAKTATARDIDEDGTVVGTIDNATPYVWLADGTHHALKIPDLGTGKKAEARVFQVRGGWATGMANEPLAGRGQAAPGDGQAVLWNLRTGTVAQQAGLDMYADGVNAQGWQVGVGTQGRAVLLAGGATVTLPGIADRPAGQLHEIPKTLSDDGRVISGQSDDESDVIKAVVWRCK
ncbi:hypothetical protein [Actinoplanes awajinensis]|uniref:Uncharacterized protein n=1 Tax=Actinoplanes awajinensis subsp. mycoplanecinus TaxID=135947 RepID=A0A0X3UMH1_9ACTN|nr:hypothetical protein [Actinoplanes awajinensis]KUL33754.1 hypothetical protein ADL15_17310 [Actinoplanes awajinensis subsp. mycoplanecinus]